MHSSNHRLSLGSQSSSADEQEMFASFDKLVVEQTGSASHSWIVEHASGSELCLGWSHDATSRSVGVKSTSSPGTA